MIQLNDNDSNQTYTVEQVRELLLRERNDVRREMEGDVHVTSEKKEKIKFCLNFELAQCMSKTELALQTIARIHYQNSVRNKYSHVETVAGTTNQMKEVTIVFTNNSLLEGKAWKSRTAAKFIDEELIVQRLASDSEKNSDDFSVGTELISAFATFAGVENSKQLLGDVLIMCNHPVRINDILKVIETNAGLVSLHGVKYKFNIFFDECDSSGCLTNMVKFVKNIYAKKLNHLIGEIQLITATPTKEMHQKLIYVTPDAAKLLNIKKTLHTDEIRIKDYRTILYQEYIHFDGPKDPLEYVKKIVQSQSPLPLENPGDVPMIFTRGKIYFIPAHHRQLGHEEMSSLKVFEDNGYHILMLNGKHKEFRFPWGEKRDIVQSLKKGGELRDILREWRSENPNAGLVITGNKVLERGLTFLTDGFNFDYMIISSYFAKNIHDLLQIVGRGQGKEQYVDPYKVIMPQQLYSCIKKYIENSEKLLEENPEFFDQDMLASISKVDKFENIEYHSEDTIEQLNGWVQRKFRTTNNKSARIKVSTWKNKRKENGFVMHKFGESEEKIWSEEDALKQRGGMGNHSRRIFPYYTDLNDATTLKWYIFYRNDSEYYNSN